MKIDLNCDLGESFGAYTIGMDSDVIPFISSCNIACGYHAGDALVMDKTVGLAKAAGIGIGAHPGFPDLVGFGRRTMAATPTEVKDYIIYQVGALMAFTRAHGVKLNHVKPHGALYNMAAKDEKLAMAVCEGIQAVDPTLILLGLSGSMMLSCAEKIGLPNASEVFADRAYEADGTLVARNKAGAMITDENEAVARVVKMATEGKVTAINGQEIPIVAHSVCVHGDNAHALAFVQKIRKALQDNQVEIAPLETVLHPC